MFGLDDILKVLDRWGEWRRMRESPSRIDELEKQVEKLKTKLGDEWPADVCKFCGKRASRLSFSMPANDKGISREEWKCKECGRIENRTFKVGTK